MVWEKGYLHGSDERIEITVLRLKISALVWAKPTLEQILNKYSAQRHYPITPGTIHTTVKFLPRIRSIAVNSQDHHPAADGAHWN